MSPVEVVAAPRDAFDLCWLSRLDTWRPSLMSLIWLGMLSRYLRASMVVLYLLLFRKRWKNLEWLLTTLR